MEENFAGCRTGADALRRGHGLREEGLHSRGRAAHIQRAARDGERRERDDTQPRGQGRGIQRGARLRRRAAARARRRLHREDGDRGGRLRVVQGPLPEGRLQHLLHREQPGRGAELDGEGCASDRRGGTLNAERTIF